MTIRDITTLIEQFASPALQESDDNAGLLVGNANNVCTGVLVTLDVTEAVVQEAVDKNLNLIVAHHPIIFVGLKRLNGNNYVERTVIKAIKHDIAIYVAHTNADNVLQGVNAKICEKLGLVNTRILSPMRNQLRKLVTFVPHQQAEQVRLALFAAGAGHIGNYDSCSYNIEGHGTFRGNDNTNPFVGERGQLHNEPEVRVETIYPKHIERNLLQALKNSHPYEEVAYDIYLLDNQNPTTGAGMVGSLPNAVDELAFLQQIKNTFGGVVRYTPLRGKPIQRVAVCGGSGSFLLNDAIAAQADIFITADFKYHQFFDADNKIVIADIGHFESEQYTKEIFYDVIIKKYTNFAVRFSDINTNPVNYL